MRRRQLLAAGGCACALAWAGPVAGAPGARVVVVGGGFGGASAALTLKRLDPALRVTLVEAGASHMTCPFSNAAIAGMMDPERLVRRFDGLRHAGIKVIRGAVVAIEADQRRLRLAQGECLDYDRLILSPGIDFRWGSPEGYDPAAAEIMPHAWRAGAQTLLLRSRLRAMADGGLVVMVVPGSPYRCPPGPYERASLFAWYLSRAKPRSKILILDAKDSFSKQALFLEGWKALYGDMIEWVPAGKNGRVVAVNAKAGTVETDFETYSAALVNVIPAQTAGRIALAAGLADNTGFCPVDPITFESRLCPGIHVIGDAALAGEMPKSASSANAQGKMAATAVTASLRGRTVEPALGLNVCYSLLAPHYAISVTGVYEVRDGERANVPGAGGVSPLGASPDFRRAEADYARGWYANICADSWG